MLFSNDQVATFISENFEPAWESVRPVPIVKIDFGNGKTITRTMHGNIASYVCAADGTVLDILPGIYLPTAYKDQLNQFRLLHAYANEQGKDKRDERLKAYHTKQAEALKKDEQPDRLVETVGLRDVGKRLIERGPKRLVAALLAAKEAEKLEPKPAKKENIHISNEEDLLLWTTLAEDTEINEKTRRRQIHEILAAGGQAKPSAVVKRLYKDVLHADLDDPYLGLGEVLSKNNPFKDEDVKK